MLAIDKGISQDFLASKNVQFSLSIGLFIFASFCHTQTEYGLWQVEKSLNFQWVKDL